MSDRAYMYEIGNIRNYHLSDAYCRTLDLHGTLDLPEVYTCKKFKKKLYKRENQKWLATFSEAFM
jgi:hypothetical protein